MKSFLLSRSGLLLSIAACAVVVTNAASSGRETQSTCSDNQDFTFEIKTGENVPCTWILKNSTQAVIDYRRTTWCADQEVVSNCAQSCGDCGCQDDPDFKFTINKDGPVRVRCAWISRPSVTAVQRQNRFDNWCQGARENPVGPIMNFCPLSCGKCGTGTTPAPSPSRNDNNPRVTNPSKATKSPATSKTKQTKAPSATKKTTKSPSPKQSKGTKSPSPRVPKSIAAGITSTAGASTNDGGSSGAAVAVPIVLIALVGIVAAFMMHRRRRRNIDDEFAIVETDNNDYPEVMPADFSRFQQIATEEAMQHQEFIPQEEIHSKDVLIQEAVIPENEFIAEEETFTASMNGKSNDKGLEAATYCCL